MNYSGNPDNWPESIPRVADQIPPDASDLDVPLEALADRTANLERSFRFLPVLNFSRTSTGGAPHNYAFFDAAKKRLYAVGNVENVRASADLGLDWDVTSQVAGVGSDEDCVFGDADASGNVVVSTAKHFVFELTESTSTWTKVNAIGGLGAFTAADRTRVVHDPIHSRWVWMGSQDGTPVLRYSTNRTTWTLVTPPFATVTGADWDLAVKKSTGRILLVQRTTATEFKVYASTDGGGTWPLVATIVTPSIPSTTVRRLSYAPDTDRWIFVISNSSGTQVWTSTNDGASWTQSTSMATPLITNVCSFHRGRVWCAVAVADGRQRIVYSNDRGTTWRHTGHAVGGTIGGVVNIAGGLVVIGSATLFYGPRSGMPDLGVLT